MFGTGAGIFFIGYFLFEIPNNLALHRFGARKWIARIMISWGFWTVPMRLLSGTPAAPSLALVNSVGSLGGFAGPCVTGWIRTASGGYTVALLTLRGGLAVFGVVMFVFLGASERRTLPFVADETGLPA